MCETLLELSAGSKGEELVLNFKNRLSVAAPKPFHAGHMFRTVAEQIEGLAGSEAVLFLHLLRERTVLKTEQAGRDAV